MAAYDFMPLNKTGSGAPRIHYFPVDAGETFVVGEPVGLRADGQLQEGPDDTEDQELIGIAAGSGDTVGATGTLGHFNQPFGQFTPGDGFPNTNDLIPVYLIDDDTLWITDNFATDGAGTAATPLNTHIGDEAGFTLATGVWYVDIGTTDNLCRIMDVLDANYMPVRFTGGTGVYVVFGIYAHQNALTAVTAPAAAT